MMMLICITHKQNSLSIRMVSTVAHVAMITIIVGTRRVMKSSVIGVMIRLNSSGIGVMIGLKSSGIGVMIGLKSSRIGVMNTMIVRIMVKWFRGTTVPVSTFRHTLLGWWCPPVHVIITPSSTSVPPLIQVTRFSRMRGVGVLLWFVWRGS